jgi:hypothetical protein
MSTQNSNSVAITGGTIDGTTIGGTTAAAVTGTTITANTQFTGAGTGLTGTASSLSIGGNAATATSATTATNLAGGTAGSLPYQSATSTTTFLAAGTNGQILTLAAGVPAWTNAPATGVTTFSAGTTGFSPSSATSGAVTLAGTLNVANGGTGVTTSTGSGSVVLSTSPSLVTPDLGTPTSGNFSTGTFTWPTFNQNTTGTAANVTGIVAIANGGTNATATPTNGGAAYGTGSAYAFTAAGTAGQVLTSNGAAAPTWEANASGLAITDDTTTNATRYLTFTSATTGSITGANVASTKLSINPSTGILSVTGIASPAITNQLATTIRETATVSATAATGTINYDTLTQVVLYYTTNASGNFTVNFRGNSGTTLDSVMSTGQSLSATFLVTNGGTAYYNSAVTIDGSSVTPKWQGGSAPTSGNASSVDTYTYVIVKTGSATFTVLASQTKFA